MSLTRKEFFRQVALSLGKTVLDISDTLKGAPPPTESSEPTEDFSPSPAAGLVAKPFSERCLARSCGCFACVERCEAQAITVVPGSGIRVDPSRCIGCGTCEYVCPVSPKAVVLVA